MIAEDAVLDFAGALFRSVWAVELLLTLKRRGDRPWPAADIVKELRGSRVVVTEALNNLIAAGLVVQDDAETYRYCAVSHDVDALVVELAELYASKPTAVIRKIVTSPSTKLQTLSDAFRIKK